MMNPNIKHVVLVLDRSGSMHTIASDTTGGVASLLEDQVKAANQTEGGLAVLVTLAQFDDKYELVHDRTPIEAAARRGWVCQPRGMTALMDAIGKTVASVRQADQKLSEDQRPGVTVLVIVTDGLENSSTEYRADRVRELIGQCRADGWEVLFLAANQDAWATSDTIGIARTHSSSYAAKSAGTRSAYASASGMVANSGVGGQSVGFTDQDREAMQDGQPETD